MRTDTEHHLLSSGDRLERIRYFTAPVGQLGREGEAERQRIWLRAVKTIQGLDVVRGFHRGNKPRDRKEKQSDVNIAVEMLLDAVGPDSYQHAILLSGDDDLIPAVKAVCRRIEPARTVDVWSPLAEPSARWRGLSAMTSHVTLATVGPEMLLDSRLPDRIERDGSAIECPHYWRLPPEQEKLWLLRSRLKLKATARPLVGIGPEELATALIQGKYSKWARNLTIESTGALLLALGVFGSEYNVARSMGTRPTPRFAPPRTDEALERIAEILALCPWRYLDGDPRSYTSEGKPPIYPPLFGLPAFEEEFREQLKTGDPLHSWAVDLNAYWFKELLSQVGEYGVRNSTPPNFDVSPDVSERSVALMRNALKVLSKLVGGGVLGHLTVNFEEVKRQIFGEDVQSP